MRGLWDNEQTLSPSLVRSATALLGGFMAALAAVNAVLGVGALLQGDYGAALIQATGGLGLPFAIWLAARLLADMLAIHHRSLDRLTAISEAAGAEPPAVRAAAAKTAHEKPIVEGRAADDGPAYPGGDETAS
jgi:hypothetical protein